MHQVLEKVHNNKIQKGNRSRIVHLIPKTKESNLIRCNAGITCNCNAQPVTASVCMHVSQSTDDHRPCRDSTGLRYRACAAALSCPTHHCGLLQPQPTRSLLAGQTCCHVVYQSHR